MIAWLVGIFRSLFLDFECCDIWDEDPLMPE